MSSEIVAAVDGTSRDDSGGRRIGEYILGLDLFRGAGKPFLHSPLVGGHDQISKFLATDKGHKHITQLSPTPCSILALTDQIKIPSVLLLQGCDDLFLPPNEFPFALFKTLTCLEISSVTNLTTLPWKAISEMTQLQTLNLSYLPIQQLPEDDFLSSLTNLRSLVLRGCSDLLSLPKFPQLAALESLDLSHLLIETLPEGIFSDLTELRWVILSGCSKLLYLPSTQPLEYLRVLDLSNCTSLQEMEYIEFVHPHLEVLDLSSTALLCSPNLDQIPGEANLYFRDTKVTKLNGFSNNTQVLDLSGAQNLQVLDCLSGRLNSLIALDLSRTEIDSLDVIHRLFDIRILKLRECNRLRKLPPAFRLQIYGLVVLDLSGCEILTDLPEDLNYVKWLSELNLSGCICLKELREGLFDQMTLLEKLDISKTQITHLPSLSNLINLRTLNLSHTSVEQVPGLSNLVNLVDFFFTDCPRLKGVPARFQTLSNIELHPRCRLEGRVSMPNQIHLVSTFFSESGFDRFKQGFSTLVSFIPKIQQSVIVDLNYILDKIDLLESSNKCASAEELLNSVIETCSGTSPDVDELRRKIVKLKLLVPRTQEPALETKKPKKIPYVNKYYTDEAGVYFNETETRANLIVHKLFSTLHQSSLFYKSVVFDHYDSLTVLQRKCFLSFALFSHDTPLALINERILIHLWYAEGFIEPSKEVGNQNTVEEVGQMILMVLYEKSLIQRAVNNFGELRICFMHENMISFARAIAKVQEGMFQFDYKNGKLGPHIEDGSEWTCLLKPQEDLPSSSNSKLPNSSSKLQSLETIGTLVNVKERYLNMRADIFSKMSNLNVLHLGKWRYLDDQPIEVVDLNFLEVLKNMKQLRLLSLEGFSTINKLPDAVCKATSLKILNLRGCSYLEELPARIGSLKNLTHLDLTGCHILSKLPKGLRLLSNLEVLKGFVISYQMGGEQQENTCTFRDLLKLERLRKLSLVVNSDKFPNSEDLRVFKEMTNLHNLKITWENDYNKHRASQDVLVPKGLRPSIFQQMKCWEKRTRQRDTEEQLRSNHLNNLKKLSLNCFPLENAPDWLDPHELIKLEKLVIVGGELTTFVGDTESPWNVKTLRLGYLQNLDMDWEELRRIFSNMTHFEQFECYIRNCPVYFMWKIEMGDHDQNQKEVEAFLASLSC